MAFYYKSISRTYSSGHHSRLEIDPPQPPLIVKTLYIYSALTGCILSPCPIRSCCVTYVCRYEQIGLTSARRIYSTYSGIHYGLFCIRVRFAGYRSRLGTIPSILGISSSLKTSRIWSPIVKLEYEQITRR